MTDRYKSRASTRADGCGKWYIVDVVVREKILVEISDGEDECDAKEIALEGSHLFRQTEKDNFEVQVDIEPAPDAPECLDREMRCAHRVIPRWDGGESRGTKQDRGHGHYECAAGKVERLQAEVEKLRADLKESDEIREKLGHLLKCIAAALKGEPPEGVWHSWHDLPEKATQLVDALRELEGRKQRDEARVAELERFRAVVQTAMQIHVIDEDAIEWINQRLTFMRGEEA